MLPVRVALISHSESVTFAQMVPVANALTMQLNRDAGPIWSVAGSVVALQDEAHMDPGTWPIFIEDDLDAGMAGNHATEHNQPLAMIEPGPSWSLTASHEMLEMVVDPSGNRLVSAPAVDVVNGQIEDVAGKVEYLVEVCDPSEDPAHAYLIDDVLVAEFYTPAFFDPAGTAGSRYSFKGSITRPRQVLPGGYLTWFDPATRRMRQAKNLDTPTVVDLGDGAPVSADLLAGRSLRTFVDGATVRPHQLSKLPADHPAMRMRDAYRASLGEARVNRASIFRDALARVTKGRGHGRHEAGNNRGRRQ